VVSLLAAGRTVCGFKPSLGDRCLRAIKILSTPSVGWEVKPEAPGRKSLRHIKESCVVS
jgi:hypothetical protein